MSQSNKDDLIPIKDENGRSWDASLSGLRKSILSSTSLKEFEEKYAIILGITNRLRTQLSDDLNSDFDEEKEEYEILEEDIRRFENLLIEARAFSQTNNFDKDSDSSSGSE